MGQEIWGQVKADLDEAERRLGEAKEYLKALEEAGEDVTALREEVRILESRITRWRTMLKRRGIE